ncbi:hypothetical protein [Sphingomonas sp. G-3-2-10]|uniref:hypothetical protein n=1 Tax=Sphingomonas sp. G-3-2-10 TaxID=2728838 RepID=UPI00146AD727|nr:hypothetical protein [Sphingomonas sp. G-3-2-10]NML04415.1 hypothetical protein [Sphingomonas sp. G-3-2-10]
MKNGSFMLAALAGLAGCAGPADGEYGITSVSMRYTRPPTYEAAPPGDARVTIVETRACEPRGRDRRELVAALLRTRPDSVPDESQVSAQERHAVRVDLLISLRTRDGGFNAGIPMRAPERYPVRIHLNDGVSWIDAADLTILQDIARRSGCTGRVRSVAR